MKLTPSTIKSFQKEILAWYKKNKRDLPWRKDRNPYHILISEVMLQQTQVSRVIPKYEAWNEAFPTLGDLAKASSRDVLLHWSGLGYNRRALYLQKCALKIVQKYQNNFPRGEKSLQSLPGIGDYTARAILCFAFNKQVAVVDTNIKKVIAVRFFKGQVPEKHVLQEAAQALLPKGRAYEWNQALMDYASAELKKEKIPLSKQSPFKDSDRYYRGQIIKALLVKNYQSLDEITQLFAIAKERLERILQGMEKDKLLQHESKTRKFFLEH